MFLKIYDLDYVIEQSSIEGIVLPAETVDTEDASPPEESLEETE